MRPAHGNEGADLTALAYLHQYWRQVAPDERLRFLVEMLTPNERRALQMGFEEVEEPPSD
jgi:hypothetical protein